MKHLDKILWDNRVSSYAIALGIVMLATLAAAFVTLLLKKKVISGADETESRIDDLVAEVGTRPIAVLIILAGWHSATTVLTLQPWLREAIATVMLVAWTVVGTTLAVRLGTGLLNHFVKRYVEDGEAPLAAQWLITMQSTLRILVWMLSALFLVANLGFDISALLAGLGLGGLAAALAAKDTVANFFGSLTILVNGPFRVGEMVAYQGHKGTVEAIGLRDTRIRTFDGHLVTVPNALAPTSVVENISRRPRYRSLFALDVTYDTPVAKLEEARGLVAEAVKGVEGTGEDVLVHFIEFGESATKIQVIYYVEDLTKILDVRHAVNARIKAAFEGAGISFAYPTRTILQAA